MEGVQDIRKRFSKGAGIYARPSSGNGPESKQMKSKGKGTEHMKIPDTGEVTHQLEFRGKKWGLRAKNS